METPSTPCLLMTTLMEKFPSGVLTVASILSLAPLNPSSALLGENSQLSVEAVAMDLGMDQGTDLGMVSHQVKKE